MKLNIVILMTLLISWAASEEDIVVQTKNGALRGTTLVSPRNNKRFYAFMGIPYAKPPIGDLRFKSPQRVESWSEVRNATKEGSLCPQMKSWSQDEFVGNEDCLFLNVYTLQIKSDIPKPVIVWIHGGAFVIESGNMDYAGPHYLVEEDIVFVSLNYRLGPLGKNS